MTDWILGEFYWCDTGGNNSGFVRLEDILGFTATVTPAGYDNPKTARFVHIDCLSRKNLGKPKRGVMVVSE